MKKKPADRHIDVPAEANRDRHANFTALENEQTDPADEPATAKLAPRKMENKSKKKLKRESRRKND